jgi:hypothetical protein
MPLVITGFHFSEPVRVSQIRRNHALLAIAGASGRLRDANIALLPDNPVTDIELTASLMVDEEMLILLANDATVAEATIRWSEQALTRFLADTEESRGQRDG